MTHRCIFEGCEGPHDAMWRYGLSWVCAEHVKVLRAMGNSELRAAIYDACTFILDDSLMATRNTASAADRAYHRAKREQRAALLGELRAARGEQ